MNKYSLFTLLSTLALVIAIPTTILLIQKTPSTQSTASQSATIAFSPTDKKVSKGEFFALDIWLNPGSDSSSGTIASLTLQVNYDPEIIQTTDLTRCIVLASNLNSVSGQVTCDVGNILVKLSAVDINSLITTSTKVATVQFRAIRDGTTPVKFGALTKAGSVGNLEKNIISTLQPSSITVLP